MFHVEQSKFVSWASELGLSLSRAQVEQFDIFQQQLLQWSKKTNLTAIRHPDEILAKHFLDSLAAAHIIRDDITSLLDIGSGAGFPGLPLKIFYPRLAVTLLEPNGKRSTFLHHMIGTLHLKGVEVVTRTLKQFSGESKTFACAVTRAFDVLHSLGLVHPMLAPTGRLVLFRSSPLLDQSPIQNSGFEMEREIVYELPGGFGKRTLSVLRVTNVPRGTARGVDGPGE